MSKKNERKIRFIHFADSHNGHNGNASRYNEFSPLRVDKLTPSGVNVRQDDIDKTFAEAISLAIEHGVDFMIHAGDGWDAPGGSRYTYVDNVYTEQVTRLGPLGIHYVEIAGNHNLPKQIGRGCHLKSLALGREHYIHTVYKGFYELVELPELNVAVHCVPSTFTQDILNDSLSQVRPIEGKINIGVGHFGVTTIRHYAENAVNALVVDLDTLQNCRMDYFALGDYHEPTDFGSNIRYSGSTERMGFDEIHVKPQVLLVEIDKETKEVTAEPLYLSARPMIDLPWIDVSDSKYTQAENMIEKLNQDIASSLKKADMKDNIVRLRVEKLPVHLKRAIDIKQIKELTQDALYFRLDFSNKVNKTKGSKSAGNEMLDVFDGWSEFVKSVENDGSFDKDELEKVGLFRLWEAKDNETA